MVMLSVVFKALTDTQAKVGVTGWVATIALEDLSQVVSILVGFATLVYVMLSSLEKYKILIEDSKKEEDEGKEDEG